MSNNKTLTFKDTLYNIIDSGYIGNGWNYVEVLNKKHEFSLPRCLYYKGNSMKDLLSYSEYINHLDIGKTFMNDFVKDIFRECYPGSKNPICKIKENLMVGGAGEGEEGKEGDEGGEGKGDEGKKGEENEGNEGEENEEGDEGNEEGDEEGDEGNKEEEKDEGNEEGGEEKSEEKKEPNAIQKYMGDDKYNIEKVDNVEEGNFLYFDEEKLNNNENNDPVLYIGKDGGEIKDHLTFKLYLNNKGDNVHKVTYDGKDDIDIKNANIKLQKMFLRDIMKTEKTLDDLIKENNEGNQEQQTGGGEGDDDSDDDVKSTLDTLKKIASKHEETENTTLFRPKSTAIEV